MDFKSWKKLPTNANLLQYLLCSFGAPDRIKYQKNAACLHFRSRTTIHVFFCMSRPSFECWSYVKILLCSYRSHGISKKVAHCMHKLNRIMIHNFDALRVLIPIFRATPTQLQTCANIRKCCWCSYSGPEVFFHQKKEIGCTCITRPTCSPKHLGPG